MDWGLMTFWLLMLTAIVGGRVTARRGSRYAYLMTLVFLVSEILVACIPSIMELQFARNEAWRMLGYGLFIVPATLFFVPDPKETTEPEKSVDFLYGLTVSLLTCILAMGSLLSMYITGAHYPVAVIQTILAIALFLLAISWLWTPLAGFSGLGQLWERYLQNIGTPFEAWLGRLAELAQGEQTPDAFLESAIGQLVELPWVSGATWVSEECQGESGKTTPSLFRFVDEDLEVTVYAHRSHGAAIARATAAAAGRTFLSRQATRGSAHPLRAPAGRLRDRRAHHSRHQKSASVTADDDGGHASRQSRR
jgi:hypothetical protein